LLVIKPEGFKLSFEKINQY